MFPLNMKRKLLFCLLIIVLVSSSGCDSKNTPQSQADKAFKVEQDEKGKFWFIDPAGRRFLSIGINNVTPSAWNPRPNTVYYDAVNTVFDGDIDKWKESVNNILTENGFNTLGAWSDPNLYDEKTYGTIILYVAGYSGDRCFEGLRPGFEDKVRRNTQLMLSRYRSIENVFGFFLDNEMPWYGTWENNPTYTLLEVAFKLPADDSAHQAARQFLIDRHKTPDAFGKAWGRPLESWAQLTPRFMSFCRTDAALRDRSDFAALVAERFYGPASKVVRELVCGRLILGTRFVWGAPEGVVRACGKYCDVISVNDYRIVPKPDGRSLAQLHIWGDKKPLMITEYSWRGEENTSGNPNNKGAGTVVKTQAERAANYRSYVEALFSYPIVIGAHWFEFADQSPQGRFDGEDSNYGVVDIRHRPYRKLLNAMAKTNAVVATIHGESQKQAPQQLPQGPEVVFEPGQHPQRPTSLDLLVEKAIQTPHLFQAENAKVSLSKVPEASVVNYDTGDEWGCGVLFFGPERLAVSGGPKHATDLDGYSLIMLDAEIPAGLLFDVFLDEAGVSKAYDSSYDTGAGDDGESFKFKTTAGKGERYTYKFDLQNLRPRLTWGNQMGNRRLDIHAMRGIGILLHAGRGQGQIKLYSLKLTR